MSMSLPGKVALVTGTRSKHGMGYVAALKLAEEGADIVMTQSPREALKVTPLRLPMPLLICQ